MAKQYYCFLKKFNNYFNRKIIKYESLEGYQLNSEDDFIPTDSEGHMTPFDFNPNDNVTTEITANDVPFDPDYFLLLDDKSNIVQRWFCIEQKRNRQGQWLYQLKRDVVSDNLDSLLNAPIFVEKGMLQQDDPFIVNSEGMNLNQIKRAEWFIRDQSKTAWIVGYLAKNAGGSDINVQVDREDLAFNYKTLSEIASEMGTTEGILSNLVNFGNDVSNKAYFTSAVKMKIWIKYMSRYLSWWRADLSFGADFNSGNRDYFGHSSIQPKPFLLEATSGEIDVNRNDANFFISAVVVNKALWLDEMDNILGRSYYLTENQLNILKSFNGTYVKYNGDFYRMNVAEEATHETIKAKIKKDGTYISLDTSAEDACSLSGGRLQTGTYSASSPDSYLLEELKSEEKTVVISLKYLSASDYIPQLNTQISSGRKTTIDQECDIFAIPLNLKITDNGNDYETIEMHSRRIASAISLNQNAKVYDLQLLPYCPIPSLITNNNEIDITNLTEHEDYDLITKNVSDTFDSYIYKSGMTFTPAGDGVWTVTGSVNLPVPAGKTLSITSVDPQYDSDKGEVSNFNYSVVGNAVSVSFTWTGDDPADYWTSITIYIYWYYTPETSFSGIIFYVQNSTFSMNIPLDSEYYTFHDFSSNKKIASNCLTWRLVSPNYQGSFEFNIAKNGGRVESWNVFLTYKTFTPTIKVAPNFNWLYGGEFADNRGLLCAGDFSLPRVADEWITYQLNNKNYQNIFNRDIQHLDFMQSIEMRNQLVSGGVGIFSDAVKGATAGGLVGGGWGALAGGILGAGASAIGYGIDVDTMARTHRENKQLAIDKFNYQLGNIKALPYTLTKVGSFDAISKIFPFVEYYSCSDKELEAFENKIKYESMTVMRIGTLSEFMNFDSDLHYFKGSLIRNDEIADDSHVLNAIYEELLKGVYI